MRRKGSHEGQEFVFDIIAHNDNETVIIDVKTILRPNDTKSFFEKLNHAKEWLAKYKTFNIYGAVAYLQADIGSELFAENQKLFVIKAMGN